MSAVAGVNMKAVVFLCLLEAVFIQAGEYSWEGPGGTTQTSVSEDKNGVQKAKEVCLEDQAACGCCLMQKNMHRMEMFFNSTLNELEEDLRRTKQVLNNLRASRVAISVALNNEKRLKCYGPFRENEIIKYKHIFINLGDSYNADTGLFLVPRSGVYNIALTVYSDAGSPGNSLSACASLRVNRAVVAGPSERNMQDQEDSATIVAAMRLKAGDMVDVILPYGCYLCDDESHYNTFSAFLLYATD